jgi:hypothetical protein
MWSAIVLEFTQKSMLVRSNMHSKFMAMHYTIGANLHAELDHVCIEYETLLNADVAVTDNDYRTLVINFLPSHLASFVAQISANTKAIAMVQHAASAASSTAPVAPLDPKLLEMSPESMMTLALEEYDRQADKKTSKPKDTGVAASTMASEKPGSRTGKARTPRGKDHRSLKESAGTAVVRATSQMCAQALRQMRSRRTRNPTTQRGMESQSQAPVPRMQLQIPQPALLSTKLQEHGARSIFTRINTRILSMMDHCGN